MSIGKRKRKDGSYSYYIQYTLNGKRVTETVPARTERQARKYEIRRLDEIEKQKHSNDTTDINITFAEWAEQYVLIKETQGRKTIGHIKQVVSRLASYFNEKPLYRIAKADVERYVSWRKTCKLKNGRTLKPATVNRDLAQLKNLFEEAARNGIIPNNPAQYVRFLKEHNARTRVLTEEEFERLVDCAAPHLKGVLLVAYHTGMRRGEILGLTWDKVDLEERVIRLQPEDTKTDEGRIVPLNTVLIDLFAELSKVRHLKHDYVFTYKGERTYEFKHAFETACKEAGIEDFRFHDLRHCFNTRARRAGIHDHLIMKITGHKTREMFRRYDTVDEMDIICAIEKLEKCSESAARKNSGSKEPRKYLKNKSGREDLNLRPPEPHSGALPDCATPRCLFKI